jgi:hypothetical protein
MFLTNELMFRKLEESDLADLLCLKNESWLKTHQVSFLNMEDQKEFFLSFKSNVNQPKKLLLIACKDSKQPIGLFSISNIDYMNRSADVGWALYPAFRGKKFGHKLVSGGTNICFRVLNLRKLTCEILPSNVPSLKCAQSTGYVEEGLKKESVFKLGKYIDSIVMGCLSSDFPDQPIAPFVENP